MAASDTITLGRLSFRVAAEQMAEFETAYRETAVPFLESEGLVESFQTGRPTPGFFSRLFQACAPAALADARDRLQKSPTWLVIFRDLGARFGTAASGDLIFCRFDPYVAPASGVSTPAGNGTGYWRTYDTTDGLRGNVVLATFRSQEGHLWFVTPTGIGQFDGKLFTSFTPPHGRLQSSTGNTFQDRNGHLWIGTYEGLVRFDGKAFSLFTSKDGLPHHCITAIAQDENGHLWIGTYEGLAHFDAEERSSGRASFVSYTTEDGLPHNEISTIFQDRNGHLWIGTQGGLARFNGEGRPPNRSSGRASFVSYTTEDGLPHNGISTIFQDRNGHLWIGTQGGLARFNGERRRAGQPSGKASFTSFTANAGLPHSSVSAIFQDENGHLWICFFSDSGLVRFDGESFTPFIIQNSLLDSLVRVRHLDRQGHLWIGTRGGLNRFDGKTLTEFTTQDGLPHNNVQSIHEDDEGHLWVGTYGGLCQYFGNTLTTFTTQNGLPNNDVWAILEDRDGSIWFGTNGGGVCRFDREERRHLNDSQDRSSSPSPGEPSGVGTFTTFTTRDGLPHNKVLSILQDRAGAIWLGTRGGVCRFDREERRHLNDSQDRSSSSSPGEPSRGGTFTTFTTEDGLPSNTVWKIAEDRQGDLWFGANAGGVSRYDGQVFTTFTTQNGLVDDAVWAMMEDRSGDLWPGTHYNGVSRFDGQTFQTFAPDTFSGKWVSAIAQDRDGHLWLGTQHNGVIRHDGRSLDVFTIEDWLADNWVSAIAQDRRGHLWFGTSGGGVSRYDGQVFQTLTHRDGLAGNVVYAIVEDRNGDIWFATNHGVTRYRPSAGQPPPVFIDAVVADRRYRGTADVEIPDSTHLVAVEFHAMSFRTLPGAMVYQYRLEGREVDWRTAKSRRVEYQDLPLGDYIFHVRAIDQDLTYSQPASVRLKVVTDPRVQALSEAMSVSGTSGEVVGTSLAIRRVQTQLSEVAHTDLTVLITGETGTGKGLAARALHAFSPRRSGPFVQVNCGAIPEGLVESELFGHERGAFTGAVSRKLGKIELAKGGALFLDEVGDLAPEAQAKLLHLLEERIFERVGGAETLKADVRVIAATNRNLMQMVAEGAFREDLYFRLYTFPVRMPPLRERREDIPLLAAYFMERMDERLHRTVTQLTPDALAALQAYDWPGNVRELEHAIQRAMIVCHGSVVHAEDISLGLGRTDEVQEDGIVPLETHLKAYEQRYLTAVLEKTGWVIRGRHGAAAMLGVPESTLRYRLKKLGIRKT